LPYFSREFVVCLVLSAALVYACLFVGVWQGQLAPPEEVERTVEDVEKLREQASFTFIFLNNYKYALIAVIPLFGAVQHGFVQFNTGYVIGALAANGKTSGFALAATLLAMPHGLCEYAAYTFAVAESLALTYAAVKRRFRERLKQAWKTIVLVGVLLAAAAALELPYV
jgi:uncharacterized membrane protein SpoIIM required for sporulation